MKQKIKTINNKRLVKADNPSELGKDELLVEVDNTTGKISLFEKDATGKVNQVAGGGSDDDGPLPGALELGLEDCFYYNIEGIEEISSYTPKVNLEGVEDGEVIVLNDLQEGRCTLGACLTKDIPADIALKCYIKHYDKISREDGKLEPYLEMGPESAASIGMVFSASTSSAGQEPCSFLEIRTPIKRHFVNINNGGNIELSSAIQGLIFTNS